MQPPRVTSAVIQVDLQPISKLVDVADVEISKEHEVVLTTYAGLYWYRVGDILRVTGFYNSARQFLFVCNKREHKKPTNLILLRMHHNYSVILARVMEYTSCTKAEAIPRHYAIYWELLVEDNTANP
ncbi:GH3 family, partial [Dillenia turbinata]